MNILLSVCYIIIYWLVITEIETTENEFALCPVPSHSMEFSEKSDQQSVLQFIKNIFFVILSENLNIVFESSGYCQQIVFGNFDLKFFFTLLRKWTGRLLEMYEIICMLCSYYDRQPTPNFQLWAEFFLCADIFPYEDSKILSVCLSVPREKKSPYLRQYQSYIQ